MELTTDIRLKISCELWELSHGRKPNVSELTKEAQIALGKKIFEYLNYRDKYHPSATDEHIYEGCLRDHNVERDRPDRFDIDRRFPCGVLPEALEDFMKEFKVKEKK